MTPDDLNPQELKALVENPVFAEAIDRDLSDLTDFDIDGSGFGRILGLLDPGRVIVPPRNEAIHDPVLVPVDLQALYVPTTSNVEQVRLPFAIASNDDTTDASTPKPAQEAPFAEAEPHAAGVHLHWALPEGLLRGTLDESASADADLAMRPLPDRWLVTRIIAPTDRARVDVKRWLVFAETTEVFDLSSKDTPSPTGVPITSAELDGAVAGSLNWLNSYDATSNRFALHDPLDDLPSDVVDDSAIYVVAGWWSDSMFDPLASATVPFTLHSTLTDLGWTLEDDADTAEVDPRQIKPPVPASTVVGGPLLGTLGAGSASLLPRITRSTTLHGTIHGVPIRGAVPKDLRPSASSIELALGSHTDAVIAALATAANKVDDKNRSEEERVMHAFTSQLIGRLSDPDGVVDIDQSQHRLGFGTLPGPDSVTDVYRVGAESTALTAGRHARGIDARVNPDTTIKTADSDSIKSDSVVGELTKDRFGLGTIDVDPKAFASGEPQRVGIKADVLADLSVAAPDPSRAVQRPGPRYHEPLEPTLAIRGANRSVRYGKNLRNSDEVLLCRTVAQLSEEVTGIVSASSLLPPLPDGVPAEVQSLLGEAIVLSPRYVPWVIDRAFAQNGNSLDRATIESALFAETAVLYGKDGTYDGKTKVFASTAKTATEASIAGVAVAGQLAQFSLVPGVRPDPRSVTIWGGQPWLPVWLEWEVEVSPVKGIDDWTLGQIDLTVDDLATSDPMTFGGRAILNAGVARTLEDVITDWLESEQARNDEAGSTNGGEASAATERILANLAESVAGLDAISATLSDLHEQLLGFGADNGLPGEAPRIGAAELLLAGRLQLTRARLVDTFGRTLDLPVDAAATTTLDNPLLTNNELQLEPRIVVPARWKFTPVDPATPRIDKAAIAVVNQVDTQRQVNPVAGFLLPDHVDEALEFFDTNGDPLGQLSHEPFGGTVTWQVAPGRPVPADARPDEDLAPAQARLGDIAKGMLGADVTERAATGSTSETESALSAALRAIDTTLWTVDTFAGIGSEHIAGLVGRPIAVVRARLELDIDASAIGSDDEAIERLKEHRFPVRLGELTRTDDGLLGFFVGQDFSRLHLVEAIVSELAYQSGANTGHFGQLGATPQIPMADPITHSYISAESELTIALGEVLDLTLLMLPTARVHLTSGVLPRQRIALQRDWVHDGLRRMSPSIRVGPVLVDPNQVRLPLISTLREDQRWYRRDSTTTWRDDAILAASQSALMPETPKRIEEGYVRVLPRDEVST